MSACAALSQPRLRARSVCSMHIEGGRKERGTCAIAGALLEMLGRREQREPVVREPDAGIVHNRSLEVRGSDVHGGKTATRPDQDPSSRVRS